MANIERQLADLKDPEKRVTLVQNIQDVRVKLEQADAEIKFLTEKLTKSDNTTVVIRAKAENPHPEAGTTSTHGLIVDEIRKEFRTKTIEFDFNEIPIENVIAYMAEHLKYPVYIDKMSLDNVGISSDMPITMKIQKTPLPAALQAFQDQHQGMVFVIRDYGILLTTAANADEQHFYRALDFN